MSKEFAHAAAVAAFQTSNAALRSFRKVGRLMRMIAPGLLTRAVPDRVGFHAGFTFAISHLYRVRCESAWEFTLSECQPASHNAS